MDITICPKCGASAAGIQPACPTCNWPEPHHITDLQEGEIIHACGYCRQLCQLRRDENPELIHSAFARVLKGEAPYVPLTTWNTVFHCQGCHRWNWMTFDDRITAFEMPCPECGARHTVKSLGLQFGLTRPFLRPIVLGEWRQAGKRIDLKCGHAVYLSSLVIERKPPLDDEPAASDAPTAAQPASQPVVEKKKTQPIPLIPPP